MLGADALGMSTAPEVILARLLGLRVAAISAITEMAAGMSDETAGHERTKGGGTDRCGETGTDPARLSRCVLKAGNRARRVHHDSDSHPGRAPMQVYLPIAELSMNVFVLLGLGGIVGVLSGMFGVGGGFLITPLLFFVGIPPAVAVATSANQIVASSFSALLAHLKRRTVDLRMGGVLLVGGLIGSAAGVRIFSILRDLGQVDLLVKLSYVVFLGGIGTLMFVESLNAIRKTRSGRKVQRRRHNWIHALPFKMKFRTSGLYISVIPPLLVGLAVGVLAAVMGVGGGFIMVPAMIYLLGMPTKVVIGTSLYQIIFVTGFTTLMHAVLNYTVDIMLAVFLLVGGVIGAQIGTRIGTRMQAEQLRILLALLVLVVCGQLAGDLLFEPAELYSVRITEP